MTEQQLNEAAASRYNDERSKQLATRPVSRLLFQFALPSIIGMAASSIYNLCDSIFIGRGVDTMAIAGLAITFPLMNISAAFGAMIGVGGGAQVSVAMGEGNQHRALMIFGNVIRLDVTIGLLITFFGLVFLDPILRLFGASDVTLPYAREYMQIILAGNIITHTFLGMNDQLRSTGNPKKAMQGQLIAVFVNILLDALFIFGFGWGMRGAALATILGQLCAWVHNFRFFMRKESYVHFSRSAMILRTDIIRDILSIGLSPFFFNVCSCIVVILINRSLMQQGGAEGDSYVGVYGIVNRLSMLAVMLVMGFSQGMQPIVGFNIGARLFHRVTGVLKFAYACATLVMTLAYVFVAMFPAPLAACFTNDQHMIDLCVPALRVVMCMFPLVGGQMITNSFFQSIRKAKKSIFLSTTRQMLFLVPLLIFLPDLFKSHGSHGVDGVWWSFAVSDLLSSFLAVTMLIIQVRKLNRLGQMVQTSHRALMIAALAVLCAAAPLSAATGVAVVSPDDSISNEHMLDDVMVHAATGSRSRLRATNTEVLGQDVLIRAACCNLGESFTTNPSVDVSYSDAATGARQIKLLGLSGTYVQMLTENIPNLRGACIPYSLGYIPGPWMQSIQVSKGASSVKNGYESTTGQINIEFLKPQGIDGVRANGYVDSQLKYEANVDASVHLTPRLSASLLAHYEDRQRDHDGNGDGFMDMPKVRQYNVMQRWAYVSPIWISQLSYRVLRDERESGMSRHRTADPLIPHYGVGVTTDRYEAQWKNGFTLDADHNTSIALMLHGSLHDASNLFGARDYDVTQRNGYAQLMYETDFTPSHNLSVGASLNHDSYKESLVGFDLTPSRETTYGLYAQYTYKAGEQLTVMPGIRLDHSSRYGSFVTPRLHVKYSPNEVLTLRASAGKGYRTPHAFPENVSMMASGRQLYVDSDLHQEEAWNYGLSSSLAIPIAGKTLDLNVEYYYTNFLEQMVINVDGGSKGLHTVSFENLDGKSYSHTLQVDATYPFFEGFSATGAFRFNDARTTYDGILRMRPLTSRFKGLLTCTYKTPLELWQFDVTGQLNGYGELYDRSRYPTYFQLQAQVTREFRLFSIYVGGENLTNYRIDNPILFAANPWLPGFDATQVWGPTEGAMFYVGFRFKWEKL